MRYLIQKHHPTLFGRTFSGPRPRDVDDLVIAHAARLRDRQRTLPCFDGKDASFRTRRIFRAAERDEEDRAEGDPSEVEREPAAKHGCMIRIVTRGEIEQKLIAIVRQEKDIPEDLLRPETSLADAGIDSLDSLTILFAIEEQFNISVPDDKARAMRTFGDMITIVEERAGIEN